MDAVDHAELPYSRVGLMVPTYTFCRMLLLAPQDVPASFFHDGKLPDCFFLNVLEMRIPGKSLVKLDAQVCWVVFLFQLSSVHFQVDSFWQRRQ